MKDSEYEVCTKVAGYCNDLPVEEDYQLEDEELHEEL